MTGPSARAGRPALPHLNGRAAILATVLCAIALSLAYPVREYIAERRQIDQLVAQQQQLKWQLRVLGERSRLLSNPAYIEILARDRLHMCLANQMCYVVLDPSGRAAGPAAGRAAMPWYGRLWSSVQQADHQPKTARPGRARAG